MQGAIVENACQLDVLIGKCLRKYAYVDQRNIARFAERFAHSCGLTAIPRNPFTLLPEQFGIRLSRTLLPRQIAAQWMLCDGIYVFEYSGHRQQHTLSIALWHEFFEVISSHSCFPSRLSTDVECKLGTLFAVNLLMPEQTLRAVAKEVGHPDQDKAAVLAGRFGVSTAAMRVRLKELELVYHERAR
jgi:hypothetical protein